MYKRLYEYFSFVYLALCNHLYDEVFARYAMSESGVIVVFIENCDEGSPCGATGR